MRQGQRVTGRVVVFSHIKAVAEAVIRALGLRRATVALHDGASMRGRGAASGTGPDIVLVTEGSAPDASTTLLSLRQRWPSARLMVLGVHSEERAILRCIRAGATGIVLGEEGLPDLKRALREFGNTGLRLPSGVLPSLVGRLLRLPEPRDAWATTARLAGLSAREAEVLDCLRNNKRNKEIAAELHIAEQTVKNHVARILRRLDVATRHDAARQAAVWGRDMRPVVRKLPEARRAARRGVRSTASN